MEADYLAEWFFGGDLETARRYVDFHEGIFI